MKPTVSIIIPCFNQELFLDKTLSSVYEQTYTDWECLIIDDGSTDNSSSIAKKWCNKDNRFKLYQKENGGVSSVRNYGLTHAIGDFIQFLDGDDFLYESKLSSSLDKRNEDAAVIITSFNHLKRNKTYPPFCALKQDLFNYSSILLAWDLSFSIPIHCGLFKADLLKDFQFNETIKVGEDWLFWLHVYQKEPMTEFIDEELACYRLHERSITQDSRQMIEQKHATHMLIFKGLDDEYKKLFFERFSLEALQRRDELFRMYKKRERKISRRIKKFFKRKTYTL